MAYFHTTVLDNQIKVLPTVSTASGSIASFDTDLTENLIEVKCQIVAQQSGSGTPSPSNPRPIITYTEMNVSHSGKNLLNLDRTNIITSGAYSNVTPRTFTSNDIWVGLTRSNYFNNSLINSYSYTPNSVVINAVNNAYGLGFPIPCKPNTKYVVSTSNHVNLQFGFYDISGNPISNTQNQSFTTPNNCVWLVVLFTSSANTDITYTNPQLEFGETATAYEPFNGTTTNIPFGQTVANGVLDVTTGKLRVTHGVVDLGSLNYSQGFSGFYTTGIKDFIEIPSTVADSQLLCSIFSVGNTANNDNMYIQFAPSYLGWVVFLPSTSYATASDFKTAMSGINLVYKLATPIEIQLDSTQITALLNENNIWCDTGDTEVKYLLTVGKKIS